VSPIHGVVANTHSSEFLIHKYWGRKPFNVVASVLGQYVSDGTTFWDPFSGSGVAALAASDLGANVLASDINPTAYNLTSAVLERFDLVRVQRKADEMIESLRSQYAQAYRVEGEVVRYFVHGMASLCKACGDKSYPTLEQHGEPRAACRCGARSRFNGGVRRNDSRLIGCNLAGIGLVGPSHSYWPSVLDTWQRMDAVGVADYRQTYDRPLIENRRILAHSGATTSSFFNAFPFALLSILADTVNGTDNAVRIPLQVLLTSLVTQGSRLLPFRRGLTSGGPAWSIPGFWIPPVNVEMNVFDSYASRSRKVLRGLYSIAKHPDPRSHRVALGSATRVARDLPQHSQDVVFLDPPYGGDVPYLEFSALWNAFISDETVALDEEIVVSDRIDRPSQWAEYQSRFSAQLESILDKLSHDGVVVVTFNNLDGRAWSNMMEPFQRLGLRLRDIAYQAPAVKSAKSQMSPMASYVGDFYLVFVRSRGASTTTLIPDEVIREAVSELFERCGSPQPAGRVRNVVLMKLLSCGAHASQFEEYEAKITGICGSPIRGQYILEQHADVSRIAYLDDHVASIDADDPLEVFATVTRMDAGSTLPAFQDVLAAMTRKAMRLNPSRPLFPE